MIAEKSRQRMEYIREKLKVKKVFFEEVMTLDYLDKRDRACLSESNDML